MQFRRIRECGVAVVGGAGFLGSHLVNHLINDRECQVTVIDNLCVGKMEFVHPKAEFVHHDITGSEEFLTNVFRSKRVGFVFNYAAWPYIPDSFERPLQVFNVNATGAIKVINAAQEAGCEGILQVSSAEIYGDGPSDDINGYKPEHGKIKEDGPISPHSTYGAAKAAVDYYCQAAWRERKTPVIALRQFNCVGERETHPYVIPEIIGQLSKQCNGLWDGNECLNRPGLVGAVKLGNNSFRDFMYAGDAVKIAVELLERGHFGEVYNLGSESGVKIYGLAKQIGKLMGFEEVTVKEDPARVRPWEIWHLQASTGKIMRTTDYLRYHTLTPLEESLRWTIRWFEENDRKWPWER